MSPKQQGEQAGQNTSMSVYGLWSAPTEMYEACY